MDQAALPRFFELFTLSPTEIQLEILSHCSVADLVCVSLASHSLRALVLPHIPAKPSLLMVEQLGSSPCWDCEEKASKEEPLVQHESPARPCPCTNHKGVRYDPRMHRRKIHSFMDAPRYGYWNYASRRYSSNHATCQVPRCKKHCACISCPLFTRLRGWMGDDLRYCSQCEKFTRRLKKYKGRCMHGKPKVRKAPNNHWTRTSGLSWGRRWWKRWGTDGISYATYHGIGPERANARIV